MLLDVPVNRVAVLQHALDERLGKEPRLGLLDRRRRQFDLLAPFGRAGFLVLDGGGALGIPERRQLQLQVGRRIQIMLKQKLHRALARFASFAHKNIMPQNAAAGNEKLRGDARVPDDGGAGSPVQNQIRIAL